MAPMTLLEYLKRPSPAITDRGLQGVPTFHEMTDPITLTDWTDFDYDTLISCYGEILSQPTSTLQAPVNLSSLDRLVTNEDSLDHLITMSIALEVNSALSAAWEMNKGRKHLNMTRGGKIITPLAAAEDEKLKGTKKFPDWAGVSISQDTTGIVNFCPGDTKLAGKWKSRTWDNGGKIPEHWFWPLAQMMAYCNVRHDCRYGYLITQEELVVLRFSRESVGPGIAASRERRNASTTHHNPHPTGSFSPEDTSRSQRATPPREHRSPFGGPLPHIPSTPPTRNIQSHQRNPSLISSLSKMSMDSPKSSDSRMDLDSPTRRPSSRPQPALGSPASVHSSKSSSHQSPSNVSKSSGYADDGTGIACRPIEYKSIPWITKGKEKLTIKLALWWIHMLAAGDRGILDVDYEKLDSWTHEGGGVYRHISTGAVTKNKPDSKKIVEAPPNPSTPERSGSTGNRAMSISSMGSPLSELEFASTAIDINEITVLDTDAEGRTQVRFKNTGRIEWLDEGVIYLDRSTQRQYTPRRQGFNNRFEWVASPKGKKR